MNFLYLSEEDMIKCGVLDMKKCLDSMEYTFELLKKGDFRMGGENNNSHGLRVMFPKETNIEGMPCHEPGRWFTAMPSYLGGKYHNFGIKTYGANQNNGAKNLPRSILMMSLMDVETGAPLCYMSANLLSAMRTGAVTGLGAKFLAKKDSKKIAIIGPGVMARYSIDAILINFPNLEEISILGRGKKNIDVFIEHCKKYSFKKITIANTVSEVCDGADIIVTCNSQALKFEDYPCIKAKDLKESATVLVVSAIRTEKSIFASQDFVCVADDVNQYIDERTIDAKPSNEDGTITFKDGLHYAIISGRNIYSLYDFFESSNALREPNKKYFFASGGIPLEDVAWATECYENAKKNRIGTELQLWEESHL